MDWLLWLCFVISGAAALALEMLWMRSAGLVLGQTAATTATVLACYFAGLGLGAAGTRRVHPHPVRMYGWLEIGAAAGAVWSVGVFRWLAGDSAQEWLAASGTVGSVVAVAIAVLPTALCCGATLPTLGQALVAPERVGDRGGMLYALNTLGGGAGIVAAGFGLPALIGVHACYAATAALSALAGTMALLVGRHTAMATAPRGAGAVHAAMPPGRLRVVAAGAGALGLGLEVLWTRLFAQVLHNSVYSFSAVALVFLVALAGGAAGASRWLRRTPPAAVGAAALLSAAVATVGGLWVFVRWTDGLAYVGMQSGLAEYILRIVALTAVSAGPAALASGVVLPALWAAWGGQHGTSRPLGDLSAANTLGCIAGATGAGFLAVPTFGLRGSLLGAAVAYVVLADVLAPHSRRWRALASVALFVVVLADPMRAPLAHLRSDGEILHATVEGPNGIVTVVEVDGDLQLRLDNYYVLGSSAAAANERRLGLVPLLLHPAPHRVAFVGLATGITASAAPALGVDDTTVVELVPEVADAARTYFATWNGRLLERPDVRLVRDDGRRYLATSRDAFDVIISDLFVPWHAGAGSLYSREMYDTVARRLAPGGMFCQWLPLYQLTREEFDVIAHTFRAVFPQASLWRADFYPNRPVLGLVAQRDGRAVDLDDVGRRLRQLPEWAHDPLLATPRGLAMLYVGDLAAVPDLFVQAPLNTDDRPLIEFMAPRLTRINAAGDKDWFTGTTLAAFFADLDRRRGESSDPILAASPEVRDARRAGTALFRYAVAATQGEADAAARCEAEVRALVPDVIAAAETTEAPLADARRELAGLRTQEEAVRGQLEALQRQLSTLTDPTEHK